MSELKLSADGTVYEKDGRKYERLTHLIGSHGIGKSKWYTKAGCDAGTNVHKCCQFLAEGTLDWDSVGVRSDGSIDQNIVAKVRGYERFLEESKFEPFMIEKMFSDESLGIATTIDLGGFFLNDRKFLASPLSLIEIKNGAELPWHKLQTALQSIVMGRNEITVAHRFALYLKPNSYKLVKHDDFNDIKKAQILVSAHHVKIEYKGDLNEQAGIDASEISRPNTTSRTGTGHRKNSLDGEYANNQD